ncbi:hypothetical protein M752DRAFT_260972 [Aspergillus phoenicis ATCC 13157]|uniref:Uncharacterized protein n=1 Tax=Aspergillus phoenicis ATCC 13157 TaxID=1353007 RepID=A0A370PZJ7_ASPPH|nr:hypothetical protein M752DRAFT_260972 [Aspergillus phoenicis ATCC 13157]
MLIGDNFEPVLATTGYLLFRVQVRISEHQARTTTSRFNKELFTIWEVTYRILTSKSICCPRTHGCGSKTMHFLTVMASIPGKYTAKKQFNRAVNVATDDDLAITVSLIMAQVAKVVTGPCFHNATVEALCRLKLSRLCLITIQIRVLQK